MWFVTSILPLLFVVPYILWIRRRQVSPERVQAVQSFLERTGYRLHGREHLPLAAQAAEANHVPLGLPATPRPYVRDLDIGRVTYFHAAYPNGETWGAPFAQSGWVLQLREPLDVRWSLVRGRGVELPAPHDPRVEVDAPELAGTTATAEDAAALAEILAVPGLASALGRCAHLQLIVRGPLVILLDPRYELLRGEGGGGVAGLALMFDHRGQMDLAVMAHERVMDLLLQIADGCRYRR
jgi:hypothetical protein